MDNMFNVVSFKVCSNSKCDLLQEKKQRRKQEGKRMEEIGQFPNLLAEKFTYDRLATAKYHRL